MIRVHHLNNSRSQRVLWLLEELSLEYEIIRYQRMASMLAPPELKRIHPLGKSPVVEAGGRVLAESGAIVESIIDQYAPETLAPKRGTPEHARYLYFMHYAEGSLMPPLLLKLVLGKLGPLGWPARPFVTKQLTTHLDFLEGELKSDYFVGDSLTGADIMMSFPLEAASSRAGLDSSRPRLMAWLKRIHDRPAYKKALERGGEYKVG